MKRLSYLLVSGLLIVMLFSCDTGGGTSSPSGGGTSTVSPPEVLLGTIALGNGESAVMNLQFTGAGVSGSVSSRLIVSVTGKVRYDGKDYSVTGTYNNQNGAVEVFANHATDGSFYVTGTYSSTGEFTGTVSVYEGENATGALVISGAVSGVGSSVSDSSDISQYVGTYGGTDYGSWNGTLTLTKFYGSWASNDSGNYGTFSMNRNGSDLSMTAVTNYMPGGSGIVGGTVVNGNWNFISQDIDGTYYDSGTWSGVEVDSSLDGEVPSNGSDDSYLANLIYQTFVNGVNAVNDNGGSIANVALSVNPDGDGLTEDFTYTFTDYVDSQTGLELDGELWVELDTNGDIVSIVVDSDVSDFSADDSGLTVTYETGSTSTLFIEVSVDLGNDQFLGLGSGSAVWTLDGSDMLGAMTSIYIFSNNI